MWNETNPTSLYLGTTWELISAGKYIQTGSTALQSGGSNSLAIAKANLPAVKIQLDAFSLSRGTMEITGTISSGTGIIWSGSIGASGAFYTGGWASHADTNSGGASPSSIGFQASRAWTGTTNTAQPQTINLGDGTPLNIQPEYITLKMWKRTS